MKLSKGMGPHSGVGLSPQEIQYYFRDVYDMGKAGYLRTASDL